MKLYQRFKHSCFSSIILLICLSVILLTGRGALAAEHHVSTLDDLTDKIASADYGDTIKVLAGTYSLTDTLNITTRVTLSGGWDLTFTTQTPGASILDGGGSIQIINISASADVDGFTFQNGNDTNGDGGGISIGTSSNFAVNISNCTFTGNTAKSGGAMGIDAPTTITNCTFTGNKAASNYGGAISSGHYGKLTITDCTFTENSSQNSGGGIYMNGEPESKISNCVITKNTSGNYGGGFATGAFFGGSSANVTFESCDITNNMSTGSGAGLYLGGGTSTFISCDISGNVISGDNSGAGVYSIHASPKFINCNVSNNKTNYSSGGGGFYFTNVPDDNGVEITNCTISGNSAPIGGGLAFEDGPATITNCTFTGNSGGAYSNHVLFKGTMDFINCTIVNNTTADENEFYLPYANLSLTNTLIWNDSADKIFNTNNHSAISLDHCALPEDFAKQGDGAITNDSPVYVSTNWTPVSAEIEVDGVNHIVYEVGSSSGVNHELDFLIGAALSDDNTPKYDQIGRERKNLTIGAVEGNKVIFEINIDSGITHGAVSPDRSLASKDVLVTLTVSPDTGYYVSSVTYSGDTVSAEVISADGVYSFNMPSEDITVSAVFSAIIYPLSYDLKGGSVEGGNPLTYTIESPDFTLTNPTRTGYTFTGWTGTGIEGSADIVTVLTGSYGDRSYAATWTPINYSITYTLNGGSVSGNPAVYTIESSSFTLNNPTRTGYDFAGWTGTGLTEATQTVTVNKGVYGVRSYTATWTPITYTIRYKLNNASDPGNPAGYTIESGAITLTNPSRNGYTFDGWTGTDLTAKTQSVTIPAGSTGNREYTANFTPITYTITYELNGGTADNPTSYTVETEAFTLNNPVKAEYSFTGWTGTGVDSIMQTLTIPRGSTGNRTYTAEYEVASAPVLAESSLTLNAFKGQPASITVTATEGAEIEWSIAGNLPSGLSFSSSGKSAAISGTLQLGTSGTYSVTVTATNPKSSAEASVTINVTNDFAQSGDVTEGARTTAETADGMTRTNKATSFTNGAGSLILSADIAITAEAEEFIAIAGEFFETGLSVDVTLLISDTDYDTFTYSLDVAGLPEWLTVSGDLTATGAANAGNNTYHYDFWLSGIPTEATDVEEITFTANAKVSGDSPVLEASVSKDISVQAFVVVNEINVAVLNPEPLNLTAGTAGSRVVSASVRALYSDGTSEMLQAGDYGITWTTASRDLASLGMTFANGVLNVSTSTPAGTYRIPVTATATFGGVGGTASSVIVVTVSDVAPILSPDVTSITARRGSEVTPITITATQGTNITWSTSGILVDGLSYNASGNSVVISGTVSETAATGQYVYTVTASNTAGEASVSITITVNSAAPLTPETAETTTQEISTMTDTEIAEKFAGKTDIVITGNTTNEEIAQALEKISAVTTVTTLDLSSASGITEVKLNENSTVENVVLTGNDSVKTVEITGNSNLKSLELTGSSVTRVEANNCANLEEVNIEGCDTIEYLDVSGSSITSLNARDCSNLQTLSFGSCSVSSLNLSGCKSLENLTCDKNSLMKLDASELRNLKRIYCADQSTRAKVTKFKGRYVFAFATMRALSVTAADDSDSFTSEDLARVQDVKAYDAAGNELTAEYDAETGEITFPENAERVVYNYATGFEDTLMDVSIYPEAEDSGEDSGNVRGVGSSSGGCESGFGIFALIVAAGFMTLSKKR